MATSSKSNSLLSQHLKEKQKGVSIPASVLVAKKPELAALISKLHQPSNDIERTIEKTGGEYFQNRGQLDRLSNSIKDSVADTDNILKMFPDMWLIDQILVSSIFSPKDMLENSMTFSSAESLFPSSVQNELTALVTNLFEKQYKFKDEFPTIISNALFRKGAHIKIVLPENVLDELINNTKPVSFATESLSPLFRKKDPNSEGPLGIVNMGFLGDKPKATLTRRHTSLESVFNYGVAIPYTNTKLSNDGSDFLEEYIDVVDNYNILKLPALESKRISNVAAEAISQNYGYSNYAADKNKANYVSISDFKDRVFKGAGKAPRNIVTVTDPSNATRKSITRPLILDAPMECCIPVCKPGKPEEKVGAFFLIDIDGNFVTKNSVYSQMENLSSLINSKDGNSSLSSLLGEKARQNLVKDKSDMTIDHISKFYSTIVQRNLIEKLRHGRYNSVMDVKLTNQVSEIMLARVLCDQFTRLLYIPAEMFTYFAFEYDDSGVGRSYLDEVKMLTSIRGILMFAKVMGIVKNSINVSHVKVKLDPRDPDPDTQMEKSVDRLMRVRQQFFPFGINSMPDLADWVTRAGLEIGFEGHPDIPDVGFDFENRKSDHNIPDDDTDKMLRDYTYMRFGVTPEMVDGASQADFATTVQSQNILFSKRIKMLQQVACTLANDYIRKVMRYDPLVKKDAIEILTNNLDIILEKLDDEGKEMFKSNKEQFVSYYYELFIENTIVSLPSPNEIKNKTDKELINDKADAYKSMIEFFISSEFAPTEILGEWSSNIDMMKSAYVASLMRKWASENNILPEMFDIVTSNDDQKPNINLSDEYGKHFEALAKSFVDFVRKFKPLKVVTAMDLAKGNKIEEQIANTTEEVDADTQIGQMDNDAATGMTPEQPPAEEERPPE